LRNFRQIYFNQKQFTQEPLAQIQKIDKTISAMLQTSIDDIEKDFVCSPISKINWTSHVILLDSSLPLGNKYWYMKQSVENGWSSNVLKIQIETNLFKRQIETQKVNNFTKTLPNKILFNIINGCLQHCGDCLVYLLNLRKRLLRKFFAIKMHYPEKKGYSARSLTYMCQFARTYPLEILQRMLNPFQYHQWMFAALRRLSCLSFEFGKRLLRKFF